MKQISMLFLGFATALASAPAFGQDFTAGKTPAQLFSSDCAECHRSPNGLARNRDVRTLAGFLREHYTTKSETAGALAAYVSGFSGGAANVRNRGNGVAAPPNAPGERSAPDRRRRGDSEATEDDARTNAGPFEEPPGRHRRATNLSGEGEKRRVRNDGEVPRPPSSIATPAPVRSSASARDNKPRDATDPVSRLRTYLSSGLGSDGAIAEAAKTGVPKGRKRRNRTDNVESAAPDVRATVRSEQHAPPTALPPAATDAAAPGEPPEHSGAPASVPTLLPPALTRPAEQ